MPVRVAGVVFDFDGTLADSLPHLCQAFRHALAPFVRRLPSDAEIVATFGPPERVNLQMLLQNPDLAPPEALQHLDEAHERFHAYYEGRHDAVRLFPGILDVLRQVRQRGWPVGVLTGKSRRSAVFALRHLGLEDFVQGLVAGDDVTQPKPAPEGVLRLARHLGVSPHQMVVVGDSAGDIQAGKGAGAATVAALWGAFFPEQTVACGPTWVCPTVADLRDLVAQWQGGLPC
jgi:2-phosphoglycolate phosphatase